LRFDFSKQFELIHRIFDKRQFVIKKTLEFFFGYIANVKASLLFGLKSGISATISTFTNIHYRLLRTILLFLLTNYLHP